MNCLTLSTFFFAVTLGAPQGYNLPRPTNPLQPNNGGSSGFIGRFDGGNGGGFLSGNGGGFLDVNNGGNSGNTNGGVINNIGGTSVNDVPSCPEGQVLHIGSCMTPEITRNVFVYAAPENAVDFGPAPELPKPKVEYNIVFVRTPEFIEGSDPIVVPPPQKKTLVYVLSQKQILGNQQVIEVQPGPVQNPEVFYVNYNEGENPELPLANINLQDALNAAAQTPTIIGGDFTEVAGVNRDTDSVGGSAVVDIGAINSGLSGLISGAGFTTPILTQSRPSGIYSTP